MDKVKIGSTGYVVNKNGFGALPIQRRTKEDAVRILRKAYDHGIDYYDTARWYTDSEEKIGMSFGPAERDKIVIATKTGAQDAEAFWKDLETSLSLLKTDHIDIYQFHNPSFVPRPGGEDGLYDAALKAKEQGKILHIGITNHRIAVAREAVASGLYETMQFPFSYLASEVEMELVDSCMKADMGFICMKGLAGGLLKDSAACYAFLSQPRFAGCEPIWGIQHESELDEWLSYQDAPPAMDERMTALIEADRKELVGDFCRGCGYCMPCTVGIEINTCARMSLMLRRAPQASWLDEHWQAEMKKIEDCVHCGICMQRCPYGLNTPELLAKNLEDYKTFLK